MSKHNMNSISTDQVEENPVKTITKNGIVIGVDKLRVRIAPNDKAEVLTLIPRSTEILIYPRASVKDWYSIRTSSGVVGFCMKQYIGIKQ